MNRIFIKINALIKRFERRLKKIIIIMNKTPYELCIRMRIKDLKTLLRDKDHTKWLFKEVIYIVMKINIDIELIKIMNSNIWETYRLNKYH